MTKKYELTDGVDIAAPIAEEGAERDEFIAAWGAAADRHRERMRPENVESRVRAFAERVNRRKEYTNDIK